MAFVAAFVSTLFCACLILIVRKKQKIAGCSDRTRRHQAVKMKGRVLKHLKKSRSSEDFNRYVGEEVVPWLIDINGLPKGCSVADLVTVLKDQVLIDTLKDVEAASYMPSSNSNINQKAFIKKLKRLFVFALLAFSAVNGQASDFSDGLLAYEKGQYIKAEELFFTEFHSDKLNAAVVYNLGNCAYSLGNYAKAMGWYELANRLAPQDSDIIQNLNFVRKKIGYDPIYSEPGPVNLILRGRDYLRPDQWLNVAAGLWIIFLIIFTFNHLRGNKTPLSSYLVLLSLFFVIFASRSQMISRYKVGFEAVVTQDGNLFRLPTDDIKKALQVEVKAGRVVEVVEQRQNYCLVRLDAAEGWIKINKLHFFWIKGN